MYMIYIGSIYGSVYGIGESIQIDKEAKKNKKLGGFSNGC